MLTYTRDKGLHFATSDYDEVIAQRDFDLLEKGLAETGLKKVDQFIGKDKEGHGECTTFHMHFYCKQYSEYICMVDLNGIFFDFIYTPTAVDFLYFMKEFIPLFRDMILTILLNDVDGYEALHNNIGGLAGMMKDFTEKSVVVSVREG